MRNANIKEQMIPEVERMEMVLAVPLQMRIIIALKQRV